VDVTLVDIWGQEVEMPTGFDDFSPLAAPGHPDVPALARIHYKILLDAMKHAGFRAISSEWWHFDAVGYRKFPILDIPFNPESDEHRNPDS
jgi:D-alanyl-D-alanine dipeptidase